MPKEKVYCENCIFKCEYFDCNYIIKYIHAPYEKKAIYAYPNIDNKNNNCPYFKKPKTIKDFFIMFVNRLRND